MWKKETNLAHVNARQQKTLGSHLDMKVEAIEDDFLQVSMPVDETTHQPMGILHGGASVALAETAGSIAANLAVDNDHYCVGMEINANHVKPVTKGRVTATAKPLHIGRSTQVWDIRIQNEQQQLTCVSRITMSVQKKPS
nr:hotdog fold thioesterase [Pleionea sp. CnH1-48]